MLSSSVFNQKQFWIDYVHFEEPGIHYPEFENNPIKFQVSDEYSLVLSLPADLWLRNLYLSSHSPASLTLLGWNDDAYFHPYVFRWDEFEAVNRCLATRQADWKLSEISLLLLYQFVPITHADDIKARRQRVSSAWKSLNLFSEVEIENLVKLTTLTIDKSMYWTLKPDLGWVMDGEFPYSLRVADNADFPFASFNKMIAVSQSC